MRFEVLEERTLLSVVTDELAADAGAFSLESKSDSEYVIYLDFDGHTIGEYNPGWAGDERSPWTMDEDGSTFNAEEIAKIRQIWAYVAEAFCPFDVNVTTSAILSNGDSAQSIIEDHRGVRVSITPNTTSEYSTSGISWIGVFTFGYDTAVQVNAGGQAKVEAIAMTTIHELGHAMGLYHAGLADEDGNLVQEYYEGAGYWSPIMGGGFGTMNQWSKGEYKGAVNVSGGIILWDGQRTQDELDVITTENGFSYRQDDHGNDWSNATVLEVSERNTFSVDGLIERNTDADVFAVTTAGGVFSARVSPDLYNLSLDVQLELLDANGQVLARSAPTETLWAEIRLATLDAGTYYLRVSGDGCGELYSPYGSLGLYTMSGVAGFPTQTTVTTLQDSVRQDGVISLREAIANAQEGDTVFFSEAVVQAGGVVVLNSALGELVVNKAITLDASRYYEKATQTPGITIQASGGRVFQISGGTSSNPVSLNGIRITGGNATGLGGGILLTGGSLFIEQCTLDNNRATGAGGGIGSEAAQAEVIVTDSFLVGNYGDNGGAVSLRGSKSRAIFTRSILAGNEALSGGAFYAPYSGTISTFINCLVAGNRANTVGAIYNYGIISLQNTTVAGNTAASSCGGIRFGSKNTTHTIQNSIVAGNFSGYSFSTVSDVDVQGTTTATFSLVGLDTGLTDGGGNLLGTASKPQTAGFTTFSGYGYSAWTKELWQSWNFSLLETSVAVNAGSNTLAWRTFGVEEDSSLVRLRDLAQNPRLSGTGIDMGAYEFFQNSPPQAIADSVIVQRNRTALLDVLANDTDLDLEILTLISVTAPQHGTTIIEDNQVRYTPDAEFTGTDTFQYAISDGANEISTATVSVRVNTPPVAQPYQAYVTSNTPTVLTVLENSTDADGDPLMIYEVSTTLNGAVSIEGLQLLYTPAIGFTGTDTFQYSITDGQGGYGSATITLTINSAPVASRDVGVMLAGGTLSLNVLANDTDADRDQTLKISGISQSAFGTTSLVENHVCYTPNAGFVGHDSFTYAISDGYGGSSSTTVSIEVLALGTETQNTLTAVVQSGKKTATTVARTIPKSDTQLHEWEAFRVEFWTSAQDAAIDLAITEVRYDTNQFTLVSSPTPIGSSGISLSTVELDSTGWGTVQMVFSGNVEAFSTTEAVCRGSVSFVPTVAAGAGVFLEQGMATLGLEAVGYTETTALYAVPYDMDDSGSINLNDLIEFIKLYNVDTTQVPQAARADYDGNGSVALNDLILLTKSYGKSREDATGWTLEIPTPPVLLSSSMAVFSEPLSNVLPLKTAIKDEFLYDTFELPTVTRATATDVFWEKYDSQTTFSADWLEAQKENSEELFQEK